MYASAEGWILIDFSHASIADALFSFLVSIPLDFKSANKRRLTHMIFTDLHINILPVQSYSKDRIALSVSHSTSLDLHLN